MTKLRLTLPAALCLFAMVLGARLWVVDQFGTDIPNWDQFDAEGLHLLLPYAQGRLTAEEWLQKHNEHRVVLTKALTLGLTVANGHWDNRLEAVAHAILYAFLAVALWLIVRRLVPPRWSAALLVVIAAACGLPLAWHNIVEGFHSQQYLLLWTSLGAMWWLLTARTVSGRWWLGGLLAIAANFTMGSGLAAAAAVAAVLILRGLAGHVPWKKAAPTLAISALAIAVGVIFRADAPQHASLKAQSLGDFLLTIVHCLQWPVFDASIAAIVIQAPLIWASLWALRKPDGRGPGGDILLACAGWLFLQVAATGYARGAGGAWPQPRYYDTLAVGLIANAVALAWLAGTTLAARRASRLALAGLAVLWISVAVAGTWKLTLRHISGDLPPLIGERNEWTRNTRGWLVTGDRVYLKDGGLPYPDSRAFEITLSQPELRRLMPATVRPPLTVVAAFQPEPFAAGNLPPGLAPLEPLPTWGSYQQNDLGRASGPWVSQPFKSSTPILKIEMAGQTNLDGISLTAERVSDGQTIARFAPSRAPDLTWRAAYARVPKGENICLVARDTRADGWVAFSQPVEMGGLSYVAFRLAQEGRLIVLAGGTGACLLGLAGLILRWRKRDDSAARPMHPSPLPAESHSVVQ